MTGARRTVFTLILFAAFAFVAGGIPFTLVVLPLQAMRNPPLDPVTERPERGADLDAVRKLLDESGPRPPGQGG